MTRKEMRLEKKRLRMENRQDRRDARNERKIAPQQEKTMRTQIRADRRTDVRTIQATERITAYENGFNPTTGADLINSGIKALPGVLGAATGLGSMLGLGGAGSPPPGGLPPGTSGPSPALLLGGLGLLGLLLLTNK